MFNSYFTTFACFIINLCTTLCIPSAQTMTNFLCSLNPTQIEFQEEFQGESPVIELINQCLPKLNRLYKKLIEQVKQKYGQDVKLENWNFIRQEITTLLNRHRSLFSKNQELHVKTPLFAKIFFPKIFTILSQSLKQTTSLAYQVILIEIYKIFIELLIKEGMHVNLTYQCTDEKTKRTYSTTPLQDATHKYLGSIVTLLRQYTKHQSQSHATNKNKKTAVSYYLIP